MIMHMVCTHNNWRASEARETLLDVTNENRRCIYV